LFNKTEGIMRKKRERKDKEDEIYWDGIKTGKYNNCEGRALLSIASTSLSKHLLESLL
jgi:hypothetical protein